MVKQYFEIVRFVFVGVTNTAIDIGSFAFLKYLFRIQPDDPLILTINAVSIFIAIINSYLMNKYLTFRSQTPHSSNKITLFLIINLAVISLSSLIITITVAILPPAVVLLDSAIIGKVIATGITMFVTYFGYKYLVFKD